MDSILVFYFIARAKRVSSLRFIVCRCLRVTLHSVAKAVIVRRPIKCSKKIVFSSSVIFSTSNSSQTKLSQLTFSATSIASSKSTLCSLLRISLRSSSVIFQTILLKASLSISLRSLSLYISSR